jgi:hypothetical protein
MKAVLRNLGAVLAGLLVLFLLVAAVEVFSSVVHPFPEGFNAESHEEICRHVENYPPWVLAAAVPMWAFAAFAAAWTAAKIGNDYTAATVGLLVLAALICNLAMLPYPIWFKVACLVAIPIALIAGGRWTKRSETKVVGEVH